MTEFDHIFFLVLLFVCVFDHNEVIYINDK